MASRQGPELGEAMRLVAIGLVVAVVLTPAGVIAAPSQLYGKSVTVSWTDTRSQRAVGLQPAFQPIAIPLTLTVYISTEGHIFRRIVATGNGRSGADDRVGASHSGPNGGFSVQFQGDSMIVNDLSGGFAHRIRVTFDGGVGNCTAQVIAAKQAGSRTVMLHSITTGNTIEVASASAGAASCSVAPGNPFTH